MTSYFVKIESDKLGPFDFQRLKIMAESGTLHPDDYVSQDGVSWKIARFVPNLFTAKLLIDKEDPFTIPKSEKKLARTPTKIMIVAALCCFLFGSTITWSFMYISASKYSELSLKNEENLKKIEEYEKESAQTVKLNFHKQELTKQALEFEKKNAAEMDDLKKENEAKQSKINELAKQITAKENEKLTITAEYKQFLKALEPFERLAKAYPKDNSLQELVSNINKTKDEDFESLIRSLLSSSTKKIFPQAAELREEYRLLKSTTSLNTAETFLRWNRMCKILRDLGRDFKQSEPTDATYAEIKTQKDLAGIFIIRTLANDNKLKHLKALVASSSADDATKQKSLIAIDEGKLLANEIVVQLGFNPEKYVNGLLIPNPGLEPKKLIEDISKTSFQFKLLFEAREPKRIEYHLDVMAEMSTKIAQFALKYSDDIRLKSEMKNEITKYGLIPLVNTKLLDATGKENIIKALQKDMRSWGTLPKEELAKKMNGLFNDLEMARIAGLLPSQ